MNLDLVLYKNWQKGSLLHLLGTEIALCYLCSDHMSGLNSDKFALRLQSSLHIKLYCSAVTKGLLVSNPVYHYLERYIEDLPNEIPRSIQLADEFSEKRETLFVTAIPNGHCPGSVMFLFEGDRGTILYTGDFRLAKEDIKRIQTLHSGTRVKDIRSLYIDTTFCHPSASYLPSREECLEHMIPLVDGWICKSPRHMVRLVCKAKYGYEYLFVELSKRFKTKVHLSDIHYAYYSKVENVSDHLTINGKITQIHACKWKDCKLEDAGDVLYIQPSTMWFLYPSNATPRDVIKMDNYKYRLCYSFHSSYSEIRAFVDYVCPVNVYPNVVPKGSSEEEITDRLKDLLRNVKKKEEITEHSKLGKLKTRKALWRKNRQDKEVDDFAVLFDDDDDNEVKKTAPQKSFKKIEERIKEEVTLISASKDANTDSLEPESQGKNSSYHSNSYHSDSSEDSESELDLFSSQESCKLRDSQGLSQSSHNSDRTPSLDFSQQDVGAESNSDRTPSLDFSQQDVGAESNADLLEGDKSPEREEQDVSDRHHGGKGRDCDVSSGGKSPGDNADGSGDFNVPTTPGVKRPSNQQLANMYKRLATGEMLQLSSSSRNTYT
ncbi:protein artemis-like isoform X2 [Ptychodera flava]|uniref:protein artemis-like isoform X2 n=1 Tax=Ptychodera flava TaxID=63121 RepID=UPI00396A5E17